MINFDVGVGEDIRSIWWEAGPMYVMHTGAVFTLASMWLDGGSRFIWSALKLFSFRTMFRCCSSSLHHTFVMTNGIGTIHQGFAD